MKLNMEYSICTIADKSFIVPIGNAVMDMRMMLDLNEQAAFILHLIKDESLSIVEIVDKMFEEYEMDKQIILKDVTDFIHKGLQAGFIVE
jgi:hypothetical protein